MFPMMHGDENVAMAVRLETDRGPWTGVFRSLGNRPEGREVFTCPNPDEVCARCGEQVSIINVARADTHAEQPFDNITQVVPIPSGEMILLVSYVDLTAYGKPGILWRSPRLCADELRVLEVDVERGIVLMEGFDPPRDGPQRFEVDLESGSRVG